MSFSEWKNYKLGEDVVTKLGDGLHGTPIYDDNGEYYFINGSNLVDGKVVINSNTKKVTEGQFIKYKKDLSERTILLGINGTIGNIALYNNEMCILGKSVAYLNVNDDFDKQFIRYVLANDHFQNYIKNNASGTTIKNVGLGLLREYEFLAPDKATQTKIANILSSIDDKIELNRQTNQTLETLAQTLFKEMCLPKSVDLPDGWSFGKLGDFYKTTSGGTPSRAKMEFYENGSINWVKSKELGDFFVLETEEKITEEALKKSSAKLLPINSILLAMYGATVGEISILGKEASCNQAICAILPNDKFPYSFVYEFLKNQKEILKNMAVGGAQQNISQQVILGIDVIIPSENILNEFHQRADAIYSLVRKNIEETITLKNLRDSLLPKLMKGEIEVND